MTTAPDRFRAHLRLAGIRARKLRRLILEPRYWAALRKGIAASVEHERIPFRADTRTILDVGASRGQFALFASTRFPGAGIVCFEPLPGPFADLRDLLGPRVSAHNVAIGDHPGTASINVSASDDSSSLLPIGSRQVQEFPGTDLQRTIEVQVNTLDNEVKGPPARPCLLKVDVQGLELQVLMGAVETLKSVDEALIECSFVELYEGQALAEEVVTHMRAAGFRLAGVHEVAYSSDGSALQADFLFRRTEP
jgi:FkbM family methyltransferase